MRNPNCERIFTFNHVADCDIAQEKPKSKDQSNGGQRKKNKKSHNSHGKPRFKQSEMGNNCV